MQVCQRLGCADNIEVRSAGPDRGKGIFAKKQFKRGDAIFQERPLVRLLASSTVDCVPRVLAGRMQDGGSWILIATSNIWNKL